MLHQKQYTVCTAARPWLVPCALVAMFALMSGTGIGQTDEASGAATPSARIAVNPYVKASGPPQGITPDEVSKGTARLLAPMNPSQKLRLVIALYHPHPVEEEQFVKDVATKGSPSFGKYLTADQWNKRFGPTPESEQAVVDWAASQGLTITQRYPNRLLVDVEASVPVIENAFGVKMSNYAMADGKQRFSADHDPVVPSHLASIVQNVQGLNNMRMLHPMNPKFAASLPEFPIYARGPVTGKPSKTASASATGPKPASLTGKAKPPITGGAYDPGDIYSSQAYDVSALYNQGHCCNPTANPNRTPAATSIAIVTSGAQDISDVAGFHNQYPYLAYDFVEVGIDGQAVPCDHTTTSCDGEGTMDLEWSLAMSNSFGSYQDTAFVTMYDGVNPQFGTFTDMYNQVLNDNSSRVMSTSWGCAELSCYDSTDINTTHGIFNSLVGQGWTLVAASGDQGSTAGCGNANRVQYPSSDPDVVGAGGTTMTLDSNSNFVSQVTWTGGPAGCGANDGGSTGGPSAVWSVPSYQAYITWLPTRGVPDISLNADWYYTPQNLYFDGFLSGNGGTSIVAPELAGMFAQFNAYLVALGNVCGGGVACPTMGQFNYIAYYMNANQSYAQHYPLYDITSGCNSNDITALYGLTSYCGIVGYDRATGLGSFNALQMSRAVNAYYLGDFGNPYVVFSGPTVSHWYNTDQYVSWGVGDTTGNSFYGPSGVSGFSQAWDVDPGDVFSESVPGSGNTFYSGPQFPNATSGYEYVSWIGQGCHTAHVRPWDNSGYTTDATYGPVCYDITPPVSKNTITGTKQGSIYVTPVKVNLSATDSLSGVSAIYYTNSSGTFAYGGPISVGATGQHQILYYSVDVAGNIEGTHVLKFTIDSPTKTVLTSSVNPSKKGQQISFYATVTAQFGGAVSGTVQFKDGSTVLASRTLNTTTHQTRYQTSNLSVGSHNITATYLANGHDETSVSNIVVQVVTN